LANITSQLNKASNKNNTSLCSVPLNLYLPSAMRKNIFEHYTTTFLFTISHARKYRSL